MADQDEEGSLDQYEDWLKRQDTGAESARELYLEISRIGLCLSYDLIDKLRWLEKETLKLSDEEIEKRLQHMSVFLDELKTAYLSFAEVDF